MKHFGLLTVLLLASCTLWGQYSSRNNEAKLNADYYMMTQEYDRAIRLYLNVLKSEPENADVKYKLGICYLNSGTDKRAAIPYLEEAVQKASEKYNPSSFKEMNAPIESHFLLGSAYRVDNQLDKALKSYQTYKELLNPKDEYNNMLVDQYIQNCTIATEMMKKPLNLQLTNLGSQINNEVANYSPVLSGNGQSLAYTSPGRNGNYIFYSTMNDGLWEEASNITSQLGGSGKMFKTVSLSNDGGTLYLVLQDPFDSDIYFSTYNRNRWSRAERMDKPINGKKNETHASISADGKTIYFASDRSGGEGDLDIYKSTLNEKGKWSKPVNLGPVINTMFNEDGPVITPDGSTLYFSSEGHEGMGGFDIYRIELDDPGATVQNLGYPINTTDNNYLFFPMNEGTSGYYAMNGEDSYGSQDIYLVDILLPAVPKFPLTGNILSDAGKDTLSSARFLVHIRNTGSGENVEKIIGPDEPKTFTCELTPGEYEITVSAEGFSDYSDKISIGKDDAEGFKVDAYLAYQQPEEEAPETLSDGSEELLAHEELQAEIDSLPAETGNTVPDDQHAALQTPQKDEVETPVEMEITPGTSDGPPLVASASPVQAEPPVLSYEPVNTTGAFSYTLQLMALKDPVDLTYFSDLTGVSVTLTQDEWYRYTWRMAGNMGEAEGLRNELAGRGYNNAFIVKKANVATYTIQVMAVPGPVVDLSIFKSLSVITVTKSKDIFCRYTTGEYETLEQANTDLERIRQLGYKDAFVRRTISLF